MGIWAKIRALWSAPRLSTPDSYVWAVYRLSEDGSVEQTWKYEDRDLADERVRFEDEKGNTYTMRREKWHKAT